MLTLTKGLDGCGLLLDACRASRDCVRTRAIRVLLRKQSEAREAMEIVAGREGTDWFTPEMQTVLYLAERESVSVMLSNHNGCLTEFPLYFREGTLEDL